MAKDFNHPRVVEGYDQHIRKLIPGYELIHLQVHAILKNRLPEHAEIAVVGCGTGYELAYLAQHFPNWKFCAIDPAPNMLQQAQQHLAQLQLSQDLQYSNIRFVLGDSSVLKSMPQQFDAALAILVAHFVPNEYKQGFLRDIAVSLKPEGIYLSYDLTALTDPEQGQILKSMAELTGLTEQQADNMLARLQDDFYLLNIDEMLALYQHVGFQQVHPYSQVLNYVGLYAQV